jgi:hypothetical protein
MNTSFNQEVESIDNQSRTNNMSSNHIRNQSLPRFANNSFLAQNGKSIMGSNKYLGMPGHPRK